MPQPFADKYHCIEAPRTFLLCTVFVIGFRDDAGYRLGDATLPLDAPNVSCDRGQSDYRRLIFVADEGGRAVSQSEKEIVVSRWTVRADSLTHLSRQLNIQHCSLHYPTTSV